MNWQSILFSLPGVIIGLTAHEYCHAFAAYKLGDDTARAEGRLSINPLKHIDLIGFLFIVFAGFGWAKPVAFNPANLKNPRRDKAVIAAAGPLANLVLALLFVGLIRLWIFLVQNAEPSDLARKIADILVSVPAVGFISLLYRMTVINLGLFIFNLFPIPPLDGSHIVFSGLNLAPETEQRIIKIGAPLLFIIIILQNRTHLDILPIGRLISAILRLLLPQSG